MLTNLTKTLLPALQLAVILDSSIENPIVNVWSPSEPSLRLCHGLRLSVTTRLPDPVIDGVSDSVEDRMNQLISDNQNLAGTGIPLRPVPQSRNDNQPQVPLRNDTNPDTNRN